MPSRLPIHFIGSLSCVLIFSVAIQATPRNFKEVPELVYQSETDGKYKILGIVTESRKSKPYYRNEKGEPVSLSSLNGVSISSDLIEVMPFAILLDSYRIDQSKYHRGNSLFIHSIDVPKSLLRKQNETNLENILYTIFWIQEEKIFPIYLNNTLENLVSLQIPPIENYFTGGDVTGYMVILAFEGGKAIRLKNSEITAADFLLTHNESLKLADAVQNGFSTYLNNRLTKTLPHSADHFAELLSSAAGNGRSSTLSVLLDAVYQSKGKRTYSTKKKLSSPHPFLAKTISHGHIDSAIVISQHPYFLEKGKNKKGIISEAILLGQFDIADALIRAGYLFEPNKKSRSAVLAACLINNRFDLIERINAKNAVSKADLKFAKKTTIYHKVAPFADIETLEYLSQFEIPIDTEDENQFTPLIFAAGYGNIPAVCWFLDRGARIDHRNRYGHTALQYSIISQQKEATACLLDKGSDINLTGPKGVTPLMQAALFRDTDGAKAIAKAGGIWNLDSSYINPCLDLAIQQDMVDLIDLALRQGLEKNHSIYGRWPLAWLAAYHGSEKCLERIDPDYTLKAKPAAVSKKNLQIQWHDPIQFSFRKKKEPLPDQIVFTCIVDRHGKAEIPNISGLEDRFTENELRSYLSTFVFKGEILDTLPDQSFIKVAFKLNSTRSRMHIEDRLDLLKAEYIQTP